MVKEITSVDLRKHSIKYGGERSRKKREDPPEGMYACLKRLMTMDEATEVCRDRSVWRSVLSDYPTRDKA